MPSILAQEINDIRFQEGTLFHSSYSAALIRFRSTLRAAMGGNPIDDSQLAQEAQGFLGYLSSASSLPEQADKIEALKQALGRHREREAAEKSAAIREKAEAIAARDAAIRSRIEAEGERARITAERDVARGERDAAERARDAALEKKGAAEREREMAIAARNEAMAARDTALAAVVQRDDTIRQLQNGVLQLEAALELEKQKLSHQIAIVERVADLQRNALFNGVKVYLLEQLARLNARLADRLLPNTSVESLIEAIKAELAFSQAALMRTLPPSSGDLSLAFLAPLGAAMGGGRSVEEASDSHSGRQRVDSDRGVGGAASLP